MIKLTPSRRSQLLEQLLKANQEQFAQNPQSGLELAFKLMAQGIRQGQANRLQDQESATTKTRGANEAAAIAEILGEQPKSVFGTDLPGTQAPGAMRQHLMTQNPESPYGPMLAGYELKKKLEAQKLEAQNGKGAPSPWSKINPKDYTQNSVNAFEESWLRGQPDYGLLEPLPKEPLVKISNASPDKLREPNMIEYFTKYSKEAEGSYAAVRAADNMLKAIDEGIFAGPAAGAAEVGAKVFSLMADKRTPPEKVAEMVNRLQNSEFYDTQGGILVGQIIRLFGSGTGLSDADREYAQKIAGALRSMQPESLRTVLQEVKSAKQSEVNRWNNQVDKITEQDPEYGSIWKIGIDDDFEKRVNELLGK
jgi:hypothetical protein